MFQPHLVIVYGREESLHVKLRKRHQFGASFESRVQYDCESVGVEKRQDADVSVLEIGGRHSVIGPARRQELHHVRTHVVVS